MRRTRTAWAVAAAAGLVLVAACASGEQVDTSPGGSDEGDGEVHLTMFIWAGSHQGDVPRRVVEEYLADHPNVSVDFVESNNTVTYPKMVAAKKTTPDDNYVDFGFFNASTIAQGDVDRMWDSFDPDAVPNMARVLPEYRRSGDKGVGYQASIIGLLYNTDAVEDPPSSWSALWDPRFEGRVTTFDYQWQALVLAARLSGGGESNIDPGFEIWSERASQFKALVSSNDQLKNLLVTGDAHLAPWFAAISHDWIEEGAPLGFTVPEEGAVAFPVYLALVTNLTPEQKKVAQDIVNLLLEPDNIGEYGRLTYSIPLTDNPTLTAEQKSDPNLALEVAKEAMQFEWGTIAENNEDWTRRWDQEVKPNL